jgi:DNA replication protein DnaC
MTSGSQVSIVTGDRIHENNSVQVLMTSNRAFKDWPKIFNHDSTLTAAILDRLLHHADTIIIEGQSFRMKGRLEP